MRQRYPVGFWARLLIRVIDFGYPFAIQLGLIFALTKNDGTGRAFVADYGFYVWCLSGVITLAFSCVFLPLILRGRTLGMLLTRTLIETRGVFWKSLLKREAFFSLAWCVLFLVGMALLNHTLINKFAQPNLKRESLSNWENVRVGLLSTLSSFIVLAQFSCAISIIVNRQRLGMHDRLSASRTVWQRRYREITTSKILYLAPQPVNNVNIKWVTHDE